MNCVLYQWQLSKPYCKQALKYIWWFVKMWKTSQFFVFSCFYFQHNIYTCFIKEITSCQSYFWKSCQVGVTRVNKLEYFLTQDEKEPCATLTLARGFFCLASATTTTGCFPSKSLRKRVMRFPVRLTFLSRSPLSEIQHVLTGMEGNNNRKLCSESSCKVLRAWR